MYEGKNAPLLSRSAFHRRMLGHLGLALLLFLTTLAVGMAGHMYFDGMSPLSAFVASMTLLSGLGLSVFPESTAGQLFASLYGILASYLYLATSGIILAPLLHRLLHRFHLND